jgi:REP element-mobilizing transposase RayT
MASTYTNLLYHIIFSTKHREPLIHNSLKGELHKYLGGLVRDMKGTLLEIGGMADHVHLVGKLRADPSLADVMYVKANSSGWVNDRPTQQGLFYWQTGYAAFTVSESQLPAVREYVRTQEQHHRGMTFKEELLELLRRHNVEYDERYLWD